MQNVMDKIKHSDQIGYMKERYICCSIWNVIDIYDYCESNNYERALISVDFEKAFDSIDIKFLWFKQYIFYNNQPTVIITI